jgi:hypothetical protein
MTTDRELLEAAAKAAGNPSGTSRAGGGLLMWTEEDMRSYAAQQVAAERENYTALLHAYRQACVDAANRANEIQRLQRVWEDTRTQRDELLAHLTRKEPLPAWAVEWIRVYGA